MKQMKQMQRMLEADMMNQMISVDEAATIIEHFSWIPVALC